MLPDEMMSAAEEDELKEPEWKPNEERTHADRVAYIAYLAEGMKQDMRDKFSELPPPANQLRGVHIWVRGIFRLYGTEFKTVLQTLGAVVQDSPTVDTQWLIADNCFCFTDLSQNEREAYWRLEQRHMHSPYNFFNDIIPTLLCHANFHANSVKRKHDSDA